MAPAAAVSRSKAPKQAPAHPNRFWPLTVGAIGVVYGDIGTSPLYAFKEEHRRRTRPGVTPEAVSACCR